MIQVLHPRTKQHWYLQLGVDFIDTFTKPIWHSRKLTVEPELRMPGKEIPQMVAFFLIEFEGEIQDDFFPSALHVFRGSTSSPTFPSKIV